MYRMAVVVFRTTVKVKVVGEENVVTSLVGIY